MTSKTIACRILDTLNVPYTMHEYDWNEEELDTVTVAQKVGITSSQIFKTLVLRGDKTGTLMACISGDKELDLKSLATASGNKKVEMIPVKAIQTLTGYVRGGVSPLGVKKKYPLYIDESVKDLSLVSISAGRRGLQIFLNGKDLVRACEATISAISR